MYICLQLKTAHRLWQPGHGESLRNLSYNNSTCDNVVAGFLGMSQKILKFVKKVVGLQCIERCFKKLSNKKIMEFIKR